MNSRQRRALEAQAHNQKISEAKELARYNEWLKVNTQDQRLSHRAQRYHQARKTGMSRWMALVMASASMMAINNLS